MYEPNDFRQPHLPQVREDDGGREKYAFAQVGQVTETGKQSTRLIMEVPRFGGYDAVRILHAVLSRSSGSVKFPIKPKSTPEGSAKEFAHAVVLPVEGRPEDSVVLGFLDFEGDNDLIQRIAAYMKANPHQEFPWLDRHPAGQEMKYDGNGSWSMETVSGHIIKIVERKGEESIEILTADGKPLTLRARGEGTVLIHSDAGKTEIIAGDQVRVLGNTTEIAAEGGLDVTAGGKVAVNGDEVEMLAKGDASLAASRDVNIGANGKANMVANEVNLGVEGAFLKLITEVFIELFNAHTHPGVQTGSSVSGTPSIPITETEVATTNVKAS